MISIKELSLSVPLAEGQSWRDALSSFIPSHLDDGQKAIRLAVVSSTTDVLNCEIGIAADCTAVLPDLFHYESSPRQRSGPFTASLVVPTGIGAEIGGHDGDAGAVARLIGSCCDTLITHPNVVNASDINELPDNGLYVEGSVLARFLMGSIGLQQVRQNRLLVIVDEHEDISYVNAAVNMVNAACATWGMSCVAVEVVSPGIGLRAESAPSGRAVGVIDDVSQLIRVIEKHAGACDAVALTSVIQVPWSAHTDYFTGGGEMVNPWGGVEAMLTHFVSAATGLPTAHAPMLDNQEVENMDPGIVDPRMGAEAVSVTFLHSVLKGLHRSPRIVPLSEVPATRNVITAGDVDCLIIPDGCVGLPTLAALEQGIAVIAVRENANLMQNDLDSLPWRAGQFYRVENYLEAAGVLQALRSGINPLATRRPLLSVPVHGLPA